MEITDVDINNIYNCKAPDFTTNNDIAINNLLIKHNIPEDIFELEVLFDKLSLIVPLKWDNYVIIARALNKTFPDMDLLTLKDEKILEMINGLNNFDDTPCPKDNDYYSAIYTIWTELRDRIY
ncbi:MAG: Fe-S cluster assembly protein IscX [bacterium]